MRARSVVGAVILAAIGAIGARADVPGFTATTLNSPVDYQGGIPVVLGNVFTADTTFAVDALGFYYNTTLLPSATADETVGLYDSTGALLASTTVSIHDSLVDSYVFHGITPVVLLSGHQYTVAAETGNNPWAFGPPSGPPPTSSYITFNYDSYDYTGTLTFPTSTGGSGSAYYGPNLLVAEPGFYGLLAVNLSGLILLARRFRRA